MNQPASYSNQSPLFPFSTTKMFLYILFSYSKSTGWVRAKRAFWLRKVSARERTVLHLIWQHCIRIQNYSTFPQTQNFMCMWRKYRICLLEHIRKPFCYNEDFGRYSILHSILGYVSLILSIVQWTQVQLFVGIGELFPPHPPPASKLWRKVGRCTFLLIVPCLKEREWALRPHADVACPEGEKNWSMDLLSIDKVRTIGPCVSIVHHFHDEGVLWVQNQIRGSQHSFSLHPLKCKFNLLLGSEWVNVILLRVSNHCLGTKWDQLEKSCSYFCGVQHKTKAIMKNNWIFCSKILKLN